VSVVPCPSPATPPVLGVVVFNFGEFIGVFPEFSTVNSGAAAFNFSLATLILNNSCCSVVVDANVRQNLLYLLTAHLTALAQGVNGQPPQGIVGRIDSAGEGSVNVTAEYASEVGQSLAYFAQTKYGAQFWQLTSPFRTMTTIVGPQASCIGGVPGLEGSGLNFGPTGAGCGYNGGCA
jgi:Protein of unknown function (DUF4054)